MLSADEVLEIATGIVKRHRDGREDARRSVDLPQDHALAKGLEDGTPYLSTSQVQTILRCGASWDFSYKQKRPRKATEESLFGNLLHGVCDWAHSENLAGTIHAKADMEAVAEETVRIGYTDPSILAGLRSTGDLDIRKAMRQSRHCITNSWSWLLRRGYGPILAEERIVGRFSVPGLDFALLSYPDVYCELDNGARVVLDTKFPGKRVWENPTPDPYYGTTCEARRGYIYATGAYADTLIRDGHRVDGIVVLHASRDDAFQVAADYKPVTPELLAWTRLVTESAARKAQSKALYPDPLTGDGLCKRKWCDHFDVCAAAPRFLGA